jgi:hypothetical protein
MYKYAMLTSPLDYKKQPHGWIHYSESDKAKTGYFGVITYQEKLNDEDLKKYELMFLEGKE